MIDDNTSKNESEETQKRKREICKLYPDLSYEELAEKFDVSVSTIKRDIDDLIAKGFIKRKVDIVIESRRAEVAKLYRKMNNEDIAKMLGVSLGTICGDIRFLKKQGIIEEKPSIILSLDVQNRIKERREQILRIYNQAHGKITVKEIANFLGISYTIACRDYRSLKAQGKIKDFGESKNGDNSKPKRSLEERKRINIINQKIISLFKQGKIEKAKELLRMLRRKS